MTLDVIVIGAGVSGLATAFGLRQRGLNVRVLEQQVHVGGKAISERFDGFLMEHGPSTLNAIQPEAAIWAHKLEMETATCDLGPMVRRRYLRDKRGLHGVSVKPLGFFVSNYLSPAARISMALEVFRRPGDGSGDESIHDFVSRRFGRQFANKVMDPMAAGIFMGDSKTLSIGATFPKLVEMEQKFGSITRGIIAARAGKDPGRRLFSWAKGIAELPRAMADSLTPQIQTGAAVTRITRTKSGFDVMIANRETLRSRAIVLAVQPHVAAGLIGAMDLPLADVLQQIAAPPIGITFLGYRREQVAHPLDGMGFLATRDSGGLITGAQFSSSMFAHRAPQGFVAITCYTGGARNPGIARVKPDALARCVHLELADLLGIRGDPVVERSRFWSLGLPQYDLAHRQRRLVIEASDQTCPGLFVTGNFIRGVSVANCLGNAGDVTERVVACLLGGPSEITGHRTNRADQVRTKGTA